MQTRRTMEVGFCASVLLRIGRSVGNSLQEAQKPTTGQLRIRGGSLGADEEILNISLWCLLGGFFFLEGCLLTCDVLARRRLLESMKRNIRRKLWPWRDQAKYNPLLGFAGSI